MLTTGSTLPVTGWDASAASSSLAVLALVAYGARWTFQGVVRRILAAIQVLASGGAVVAIISSASAPVVRTGNTRSESVYGGRAL